MSTPEEPAHTVVPVVVMVGLGDTVTVVDFVDEQPLEVPVTEYTVVDEGLAFTEAPVLALSPVAGVHTYVVAPLAFKAAEEEGQTVAEFTVTVGLGFTTTCWVAVLVKLLPSQLVTTMVAV